MKSVNRQPPAVLFMILLSFMTTVMAGPAVVVEAQWVREAPPASTVLAAYMVLKNTTDTPRTVTRIDSPDFRNSQIHRTVMENGIAKMLPVERLELPVDGSVVLEPGGLHLMLFEPQRTLRDGDTVVLVIHVDNGDSVTVDAPVVRKTDATDHAHHHH
jgi:copper(I)-binding protein